MSTTRGYLEGQVAEYYDFGPVPSVIDPRDGMPIAVRVQPMYFFFDDKDRPLFSRPVRELRDGTDWIRGGRDVLNPNPMDFCAGKTDPIELGSARRSTKRKRRSLSAAAAASRWPIRIAGRGRLPAAHRRSDSPGPGPAAPASTPVCGRSSRSMVPPGYRPDRIKQVATLDKAIASGKYRKRAHRQGDQLPDRRRAHLRQPGHHLAPDLRPRIEIWYRRLLSTCFLANGWETLGLEDGRPFFANSDAERVDTFDVVPADRRSGPRGPARAGGAGGQAYEPASSPRTERRRQPTLTRVRQQHPVGQPAPADRGDPGGLHPDALDDRRAGARTDYAPGGWKSDSRHRPQQGHAAGARSSIPWSGTCPCAGWRSSARSSRTTTRSTRAPVGRACNVASGCRIPTNLPATSSRTPAAIPCATRRRTPSTPTTSRWSATRTPASATPPSSATPSLAGRGSPSARARPTPSRATVIGASRPGAGSASGPAWAPTPGRRRTWARSPRTGWTAAAGGPRASSA